MVTTFADLDYVKTHAGKNIVVIYLSRSESPTRTATNRGKLRTRFSNAIKQHENVIELPNGARVFFIKYNQMMKFNIPKADMIIWINQPRIELHRDRFIDNKIRSLMREDTVIKKW